MGTEKIWKQMLLLPFWRNWDNTGRQCFMFTYYYLSFTRKIFHVVIQLFRYRLPNPPGAYRATWTTTLCPVPTAVVFKPSALTLMSQTQSAATSSANFQLIINNALKVYEKRTKKDLLAHPLAVQLQTCRAPAAILAILQEQVQGLHHGDERWSKWLDPTVNVLFAFSATIGAGISLVISRCLLLIRVLTFIWAGIFAI